MPSPQLRRRGQASARVCRAVMVALLCTALWPVPAPATAAPPEPLALDWRVYLPLVSSRDAGTRPSSDELIDSAVNAGTLDPEAGLLYKVYSAFGDNRLPAQYRGDDSQVVDSHVLAAVDERWSSLSPSTQEALRPFLTPPIYLGSWYDQRSSGAPTVDARGSSQSAEPYPLCSDVDRLAWASDTAKVAHVKIWWPRGQIAYADLASALLAEMDSKIWPALTSLMGQPLEDGASPCGADDSRLDVYLAPVKRSFEQSLQPPGCKKTPGYIVLNPSSSVDILAHEFMHAIQDGFNVAGCVYDKDNAWLCEATASWAQDYVYPNHNTEHSVASRFLKTPALMLNIKNDQHEYGAYLLPFYLARTESSGNRIVRTIFDNLASANSLAAINTAVNGGFAEVWPKFIAHNWNRVPYDYYNQWDHLTDTAQQTSTEVKLDGAGMKEFVAGPAELYALTASYYHFKFTDPNVRSVAFYNGWSFRVSKKALQSGLGHAYFADPLSADQKKGASVQAYVKVNGQWTYENKWTDEGVISFCRDKKDERIEEMVIIYGNSAYDLPSRVLQPAGERPKLVVSNIGCWQWEGSVDMTYVDDPDCASEIWHVSATNLLWERYAPGVSPGVAYNLKRGTLYWTVVDGPCGCNGLTGGNGSFSLVPVTGAAAVTSPNMVLDGPWFRHLTAGAAATNAITYNECGDPLTTWLPFNWGETNVDGPGLSADGTLNASYTLGGQGSPVWTWHLVPKAEE